MDGISPDSAFAPAAVQANDGRGGGRVSFMHTIGVLLLAAATAGDGFGYSKPGVGFKKLLRPHVVAHGPAPPGGPITTGAGMGGCAFGHPGCAGGPTCPGGGAGGPGGPGGGLGGRRANTRSQIYFLDPDGMKIG